MTSRLLSVEEIARGLERAGVPRAKAEAEARRQHGATVLGMPVRVDSTMPTGRLDFVQNGQTVGRIEGLDARTPVADPYRRMNKTEARRAQELEAQRLAGEIAGWWYEALTLTLADDTRYTPDFLIQHTDGTLELDEVKGGFIRDDAAVKIKVAARLFPFRFTMHQRRKQKDGGGWKVTDYSRMP